jgi:hypothetical protein
MKVLGNAVTLSPTVTKLDDAAAAFITNTSDTVTAVSLRNAADDTTTGSVFVGAKQSIILKLGAGQGVRASTDFKGTPIACAGY